MDVYEVVKKLVGPIKPVGETNTDEERFSNLQEMTKLVDKLISDIDEVGMQRDRHEYSVAKAGKFADSFLTKLGIME